MPIDSQASQADERSASHLLTSSPRPRNFPRLAQHAIIVSLALYLVLTTSFVFLTSQYRDRSFFTFHKVLLMPPQALYPFLRSIGMIRMARLSSFAIILTSMAHSWTVCSTRDPAITHNNLNATASNTAEGERKIPIRRVCCRQDFLYTYSRDLSTSCQPVTQRGKRMTVMKSQVG